MHHSPEKLCGFEEGQKKTISKERTLLWAQPGKRGNRPKGAQWGKGKPLGLESPVRTKRLPPGKQRKKNGRGNLDSRKDLA